MILLLSRTRTEIVLKCLVKIDKFDQMLKVFRLLVWKKHMYLWVSFIYLKGPATTVKTKSKKIDFFIIFIFIYLLLVRSTKK